MKKILILLALFIVSCSLWAQNNVITYTASAKLSEATSQFSAGFHTDAFGVPFIDHSFADGIGTITFSGDVTSIGDRAFYVCSTLTSIDIPNSVKSIGVQAFTRCTNLISVTIPTSVERIEDDAFSNCDVLASIDIPSSVTYIGDGAFGDCKALASLDVPSSVTYIGNGAFGGCKSLTSFTIPSSVTYIAGDLFNDCSALSSVSIPSSVTIICDAAFAHCTSLTSVEIPSSVTTIDRSAFQDCSSLASIEIPYSVTRIEEQAFIGCGLTSIVVDRDNTTYDSRNNCNAIIETSSKTLIVGCVNTVIPSSVAKIEYGAFTECYGLVSIEIPHAVTRIEEYAFFDCTGLTSITCLAEVPPTLGDGVFTNVPRNIPLYVPAQSISLYQAAEQWNEFDIQPYFIEIDHVTPSTTELTWNPVDSASLYQLHLYTDSTSTIALDTTLLINADSLNGGIMLQNGTSVARRVKKIIHDAGGTIIVITIDPTSGTSEENPYKVTVSTVSGERIDVHFDMKVFQGTEILREESGSFVLNEDQPDGIENLLAPSLPTGIYDLYGHRYPATAWETLPAGVYVLREEDRVEKVMKK